MSLRCSTIKAMTKRKENPLPKGFSATLKCRDCAAQFYGSVATRYCGDQCHIRARSTIADDGSGCWNWLGKKTKRGRAQINPTKGIHTSAARVAFTAFRGPIPNGLFVCHHCDNPACVNPAHLFLGTTTDNIVDAAVKGRLRHKLSVAAVQEIRRSEMTLTILARKFGVDLRTVRSVRDRRTWKHVA